MKKIETIIGKTIPLDRNDVDTDLIIPAQYLTSTVKTGYGENLFRRLRDSDPNFIFNQKLFSDAKILISKHNFGCGSSREHAVWALKEWGIDVILAVSFADIFFHNSAKNGLLLIQLPERMIENLLSKSKSGNFYLTVNLNKQIIKTDDQTIYNFEMDPFRKHCFMNGLDDLDYLTTHLDEIKLFKQKQDAQQFSNI